MMKVRYSAVANSDIYFTFSSPFGSLFVQYRYTPVHYFSYRSWKGFQPSLRVIQTDAEDIERLQPVQTKQKQEQDVCTRWKCQAVFLWSPRDMVRCKALNSRFLCASPSCRLSSHPYKKAGEEEIMVSQNIPEKETLNIILLCFVLTEYCIFQFEMRDTGGLLWDFQGTINGTYKFWSCWLWFFTRFPLLNQHYYLGSPGLLT